MTWATISARQMVLKNRINCLESQLIHISQDLQTAYNDSAYKQQFNQMDYTEDLAKIQDDYNKEIESIEEQYKDSDTSAEYTKAYNDATKKYLEKKQAIENDLEKDNRVNQDKTDAKTQALEAQQEQIETQLEAARAEYESLDKACSNDISKGAIKLIANN